MTAFGDALDRLHAVCDSTFGEPATFKPAGGGETACTIERFAPAPEFGGDFARTAAEDITIKVLAGVLPSWPKKDDVFTTQSGDLRVIVKASIDDDDGKRYTVKVARVTA